MKCTLTLSNLTSQKLRLLSMLCAGLVVFLHVPTEFTQGIDGYQFFVHLFSKVQKCAVPLFFVMSGGFAALSLSNSSADIRHFYVKKFRTLLIPFLLLNLITCIIGYVEILCDVHSEISVWLGDISIRSFFKAFGFGKTRTSVLGVLWYVRCLWILSLIAPLANHLIIYSRRQMIWAFWALVVMCIGWIKLSMYFPIIEPLSSWMNPYSILCFFVGMIWAHQGFCLPSKRWSFLIVASALIGIIEYYVKIPFWERMCINQFISIPCTAIAIMALLPNRAFSQRLTRNAFGVYVFHPIILHFLCLTLSQLNLSYLIYSIWGYLLLGSFVLIVAWGMSELIHCRFSKLGFYLFGGR